MNAFDDDKSRSATLNQTLLSRLRLRHLALLCLLSQHRRLSRVAEVMRVGQPSVTKMLKDVEDIFGTALFERLPGGLGPTDAGQAVLDYAKAALADLNMASQKLVAIAAGMHGRIRLGVIPHAPEPLVCSVLEHLLATTPRLSVVVREAVTSDLVAALQAHQLDCVIGRSLPQNHDFDIIQEAIFEQSPALLVSPKLYDRVAKRPLDWNLLAELDWILQPPNTPMRQTVDTVFANAGVPPPVPAIETSSMRVIENSLRLLPNGITVLARDAGERLVAAGVCRPLPHELQWSLPPICLLLPRSSTRSPAVEALTRAIRDAGKRLSVAQRIRRTAHLL